MQHVQIVVQEQCILEMLKKEAYTNNEQCSTHQYHEGLIVRRIALVKANLPIEHRSQKM